MTDNKNECEDLFHSHSHSMNPYNKRLSHTEGEIYKETKIMNKV